MYEAAGDAAPPCVYGICVGDKSRGLDPFTAKRDLAFTPSASAVSLESCPRCTGSLPALFCSTSACMHLYIRVYASRSGATPKYARA